MKHFEHVNASTFEEASTLLKESGEKAQAMAGGSDLLGTYKDNILPTYPETVVNLKQIPDADKIAETEAGLSVGALAKLGTVAENEMVGEICQALKEAAHSVSSPLVRHIGTIGGNICQDVRCWYYRYPDAVGSALNCKRKGGQTCYAINGENRYHSVFGGMSCGGSACAKACPAGTNIAGYMARLRENDWDGAAQIILKYNPMPMMTSRICPHVCQDDCNQNVYGESVNVHAVERSLGDYILAHADRYYAAPTKETGKTAAVIGAGPGGLSAAYYLRKAGQKVIVYDRMKKAGGVLQYGIPHYRLPKDIVDRYVDALTSMGVEFRLDMEVGKDITMEEIKNASDSIYFGTGAWKQPILGLEGENLTEFGLDFLVEVNTYLEKAIGSRVLVCGGGNVAMDVALTATRLGAKNVKLVCLEQKAEMPASAEEVARAEEEGVQLYNGWGLGRIVTDGKGKVAGLEAKKCVSVYDENHRFSPVYDEENLTTIEADTIILATGQRVDISFLGETLGAQLRSARGLIETDLETGKTKVEGMYAGGDAATGPNIAIRAITAGRNAAAGMNRDLGALPDAPEENAVPKAGAENISFHHFDPAGIDAPTANHLKEVPLGERTLTKEDAETFDVETTLKEAARCMNCGCYAVNPSDITPVLVMADAKLLTSARTIDAADLFTKELTVQDVLEPGELVKEIVVPKSDGVSHYDKKRVRDAIDFAIVSLASRFDVQDGSIQDVRIVYGGVAPVPYRMEKVESFLKGKTVSDQLIREAKSMVIENTMPMAKNKYKLYMMQDLIETAMHRVMEA
ncbi:MAG: FAD-dependent oxidoreductase [Clostridiales bacterium]|nr:FAD-dependent oxidoreductase [Clostridiales bacterium]